MKKEVVEFGSKRSLDEGQILDLIPPYEGALRQYYGRIRNGKTYAATVDVLDDLKNGQVVYCNYPITYDGYDQRQFFFYRLLGFLGLKKIFFHFPKENFYFVDTTDLQNIKLNGVETKLNFYDWLKNLTSCSIYLDEGHIFYDSYMALKMKLSDRVAILDTGHYDRTINIISQRPTAIHVVLRANVNQFFKCEKVWDFKLFWNKNLRIQRFRKTEFQDVDANDRPDESKIKKLNEKTHLFEDTDEYEKAVSEKFYFGKKKIFSAYDTKYRRGDLKESQKNLGEIWDVSWRDLFNYKKIK